MEKFPYNFPIMRLGDQRPFGAFPEIPTFLTGMDGEPFFVTGLGGEGLGKKSMGRGEAGNPPFPTVRGGEGVKICGAGNILCVSAD